MHIHDRDPFRLSPQEDSIMRLLAEGKTREETAAAHRMTLRILAARLRIIRQKLDADDDAQAINAYRAKMKT